MSFDSNRSVPDAGAIIVMPLPTLKYTLSIPPISRLTATFARVVPPVVKFAPSGPVTHPPFSVPKSQLPVALILIFCPEATKTPVSDPGGDTSAGTDTVFTQESAVVLGVTLAVPVAVAVGVGVMQCLDRIRTLSIINVEVDPPT